MLALALVFALIPPSAGEWRRPVPGALAQPFSYRASHPFRAGGHRGADFASAPGEVVRAACSGAVLTARPGLVTLRCGRWRVTHLPVASVSLRPGAAVRAGAVIGRLGASREHAGLHLGVRRAGDRFGYVDPVPLLTGRTPAPPPPLRVPRTGPSPARRSASPPPAPFPAGRPAPAAPPAVASPPLFVAPAPATPAARSAASSPPPLAAPAPATPAARSAASSAPLFTAPAPATPAARSAASSSPPLAAPAPSPPTVASPSALPGVAPARVRVSAPAGRRALAPWPAWLGLAVLLLGAGGGGVRIGARRRRAARAAAVPSAR